MTDTDMTSGAKGARSCEIYYRISEADLMDNAKVLALIQATTPMLAQELAAVVGGSKSKGGEVSCSVSVGDRGVSGSCTAGFRF